MCPFLAQLSRAHPFFEPNHRSLPGRILYPLTCTIAFSTLGMRYGLSLRCVEAAALAGAFVVIALADLDRHLIPNAAVLTACFLRLAYLIADAALSGRPLPAALGPSLLSGLAIGGPALLLALVMDRILGRQSLGGGDIKLLFVVGMCLGVREGLLAVLLACCLGVGFVMLRSLHEHARGRPILSREPFAFGPAIVAACWVMALWEPQLPGWYP